MALSSQISPIHSLTNSVPLTCFKASKLSLHFNPLKPTTPLSLRTTKLHLHLVKFNRQRTTSPRATLDDVQRDQLSSTPLLIEDDNPKKEVEESVQVLKNAAKTRKVAAEEVLSALSVIEKAKIDPSGFFDILGGKESPGRTWMLIFTAKKQLKGGGYFPLTAVQRFDAAAKRIENGVYLGPIGQLTFEGRLSWKNRILAFIFENLRIKLDL
uniref:Plastid lipid-associated protein/fibrillin conserved domain-containing protein n=1 Tax=Lotus japonicus TaxID=34305 RepID=I3T5K4_LOTJA|nr:unknown [Lotus japonicus]